MVKSDKQIVEEFYTFFKNRDFRGMVSLYHEDARYKDCIFDLTGKQVFTLWYIACSDESELKVELISIDDSIPGVVTTEWKMEYRLVATGRKIKLDEVGTFKIEDGKIIEHSDEYDFKLCLRQAVGIFGYLFGWMNWFQNWFRRQALKSINVYLLSYQQEETKIGNISTSKITR